jgi:hypothetical protein
MAVLWRGRKPPRASASRRGSIFSETRGSVAPFVKVNAGRCEHDGGGCPNLPFHVRNSVQERCQGKAQGSPRAFLLNRNARQRSITAGARTGSNVPIAGNILARTILAITLRIVVAIVAVLHRLLCKGRCDSAKCQRGCKRNQQGLFLHHGNLHRFRIAHASKAIDDLAVHK